MGEMADYYREQEDLFTDYHQLDDDAGFNEKFEEQARRLQASKAKILRRLTKGMRDDMKRSLLASEIKKNKFYVGSNSVFSRNWGHPTVEAAVKHAEELLEDRDDDIFVVQIVRLVRRKPAPVEVKKVP